MNIDMHSHVIPPALLDAMAAEPEAFDTRIELRNGIRHMVRGVISFPVHPMFYDVEAKLAEMDRMGLDVSVLSVGPPAYCYWLPPEAEIRVARLVNDGIASMVAARPERLRGLATLPMHSVEAALAELERAVKEHGFKGVELATSIEGVLLSDPKFRPVLKRIEALGLFVFAHPYRPIVKEVFDPYYLTSIMGFPLDTTLLAAHLMFGGALDELKALRFVLPHGGGYLPYHIGRFQHGYEARPEPKEHTRSAPFEHLKRFTYDTVTHYPNAVRHLIDTVGVERVVLGTDCPS
jgi:aminocarboxymuconate-semialdehyde decarboxylase